MIKKTVLIAIAALLTVNVWGQTQISTSPIWYTNDNVGIGTISPNYSLDIDKGAGEVANMRIKGNSPSISYTINREENSSAAAINAMQLNFDNGTNELNLINVGMFAHTNIGGTPTLDYFFIGKVWNDNAFRIYPNKNAHFDGNVGIGTTSPSTKLHIEGNGGVPAADYETLKAESSLMLSSESSSTVGGLGTNTKLYVGIGTSLYTWLQAFNNYSNYAQNIILNPVGGNVGVGTTEIPSGYKFAVDGKAIFEEVKVEMSDTWADFVFEPTYNLMPLKDLDTYIQENKHLPEIPTTAEVQENGISVGEMNGKLLQKIEELTLYVIDLQKQNEVQNKLNTQLKNEMEYLKKFINE